MEYVRDTVDTKICVTITFHWDHFKRESLAVLRNPSVKLVTEGFFLNNEKHETTRKNYMEAALTASMRRTLHEIFSGHFVSFVVKKYHRHPVSLTHYQPCNRFFREGVD